MYTSIETWKSGKKWRLQYSGPREWAQTMKKDGSIIAEADLHSHQDGEKLSDHTLVGHWDGKRIIWKHGKTASSQAAWALLTEGVALARVEVHRLRHLLDRGLSLVEKSAEKDHLYQVAGDIIIGMPKRLDKIEVALDRTGLALSKMGEEFLESRLPLSEKTLVDEAIQAAFGRSQFRESIERVAAKYMTRN